MVKVKKIGKTKIDIEILCDFCGEPLDQLITDFGMDCKNKCSQKKLRGIGLGTLMERRNMGKVYELYDTKSI